MHIHFTFDIDGVDKYAIDCCLSNLIRLGLTRLETRWPIIEAYTRREEEATKLIGPMAESLKDAPQAWQVFGLQSAPHVDVKKEGIYVTPLGVEFSKACLRKHS